MGAGFSSSTPASVLSNGYKTSSLLTARCLSTRISEASAPPPTTGTCPRETPPWRLRKTSRLLHFESCCRPDRQNPLRVLPQLPVSPHSPSGTSFLPQASPAVRGPFLFVTGSSKSFLMKIKPSLGLFRFSSLLCRVVAIKPQKPLKALMTNCQRPASVATPVLL